MPTLNPKKQSVLNYINQTPELINLFYDIDMLPEQLKPETVEWKNMIIIALHWQLNMEKNNETPSS